MHEVAVLALPSVVAFELGLAAQADRWGGRRGGQAALPGAGRDGRRRAGAHVGGLRGAARTRRVDPAHGRHRGRPGHPARGRGGARRPGGRRRRGARRAPRAADVDLHRRVRAGRRGTAGRAPGHHALDAHRVVPAVLPGRSAGSGRALRRRRRRADVGGQRRGHRPVPAPRAPRPRPGGGQPGGPAHRGVAVAGGRPVAVRRAAAESRARTRPRPAPGRSTGSTSR